MGDISVQKYGKLNEKSQWRIFLIVSDNLWGEPDHLKFLIDRILMFEYFVDYRTNKKKLCLGSIKYFSITYSAYTP